MRGGGGEELRDQTRDRRCARGVGARARTRLAFGVVRVPRVPASARGGPDACARVARRHRGASRTRGDGARARRAPGPRATSTPSSADIARPAAAPVMASPRDARGSARREGHRRTLPGHARTPLSRGRRVGPSIETAGRDTAHVLEQAFRVSNTFERLVCPPPFDRRRCLSRSRACRRSSATTPRPRARRVALSLSRARTSPRARLDRVHARGDEEELEANNTETTRRSGVFVLQARGSDPGPEPVARARARAHPGAGRAPTRPGPSRRPRPPLRPLPRVSRSREKSARRQARAAEAALRSVTRCSPWRHDGARAHGGRRRALAAALERLPRSSVAAARPAPRPSKSRRPRARRRQRCAGCMSRLGAVASWTRVRLRPARAPTRRAVEPSGASASLPPVRVYDKVEARIRAMTGARQLEGAHRATRRPRRGWRRFVGLATPTRRARIAAASPPRQRPVAAAWRSSREQPRSVRGGRRRGRGSARDERDASRKVEEDGGGGGHAEQVRPPLAAARHRSESAAAPRHRARRRRGRDRRRGRAEAEAHDQAPAEAARRGHAEAPALLGTRTAERRREWRVGERERYVIRRHREMPEALDVSPRNRPRTSHPSPPTVQLFNEIKPRSARATPARGGGSRRRSSASFDHRRKAARWRRAHGEDVVLQQLRGAAAGTTSFFESTRKCRTPRARPITVKEEIGRGVSAGLPRGVHPRGRDRRGQDARAPEGAPATSRSSGGAGLHVHGVAPLRNVTARHRSWRASSGDVRPQRRQRAEQHEVVAPKGLDEVSIASIVERGAQGAGLLPSQRERDPPHAANPTRTLRHDRDASVKLEIPGRPQDVGQGDATGHVRGNAVSGWAPR